MELVLSSHAPRAAFKQEVPNRGRGSQYAAGNARWGVSCVSGKEEATQMIKSNRVFRSNTGAQKHRPSPCRNHTGALLSKWDFGNCPGLLPYAMGQHRLGADFTAT